MHTIARLLAAFILALPLFAAERPNIVVILVDDMGFSDIGCYGSEIDTPHLDTLARGGLRYTQFYNTGRCCPTRASLLTGLYPHQAGVGHMSADDGLPAYSGALRDSTRTLAQVARSAGYFTAMAGKWHVGNKPGQMPTDRGFDRFFGSDFGGLYYDLSTMGGKTLYLDDQVFAQTDDQLPEGFYSTHAFVDYSIQFIDQAIEEEKPFFLYLAHIAPHFPLQAPQETIEKYRGTYLAGWDALSQARRGRQIEMGLIHEDWTPAPRDGQVAAWDALSDQRKDRFDHLMSIYAAMIEEMDKSIGTLVAALKERGEFENTVILFMSDNGGNAEAGPNGRFELSNHTPYPGGPGSKIWSGKSWAGMQNTPFRMYKHYVHEGGIASPLIVHWPAGIGESLNGSWVLDEGHVIDIMPTLVDLSGAAYPERAQGRAITPMQGISLTPTFVQEPLAERVLYWEHEGNRAVRDGDWKLVAKGINGPWELYNLADDRTEMHDLAARQQERVQRLAATWERWAVEAEVYPMPNRGHWKGKLGPTE